MRKCSQVDRGNCRCRELFLLPHCALRLENIPEFRIGKGVVLKKPDDRALPDVERYFLIFYDFLPDHGSIDVERDKLAQKSGGLAKLDTFNMEVEVSQPRKELLVGGRERIQRNIVMLYDMIEMREVMYDKIEAGSRKVPGVALFVKVRIEFADMDLS